MYSTNLTECQALRMEKEGVDNIFQFRRILYSVTIPCQIVNKYLLKESIYMIPVRSEMMTFCHFLGSGMKCITFFKRDFFVRKVVMEVSRNKTGKSQLPTGMVPPFHTTSPKIEVDHRKPM